MQYTLTILSHPYTNFRFFVITLPSTVVNILKKISRSSFLCMSFFWHYFSFIFSWNNAPHSWKYLFSNVFNFPVSFSSYGTPSCFSYERPVFIFSVVFPMLGRAKSKLKQRKKGKNGLVQMRKYSSYLKVKTQMIWGNWIKHTHKCGRLYMMETVKIWATSMIIGALLIYKKKIRQLQKLFILPDPRKEYLKYK